MNAEVDKSVMRRQELHSQLGGERLAQWQEEHANEVLTPQQAALVSAYNQLELQDT